MIELEDVAYSYGGAALYARISLSLAPGSFHFLTGPSGAGKTTLLKLCYGELFATAGIVRLFGQDARAYGRDGVAMVRRRIGVVHQDCQFVDHLTLAENIMLPQKVAGREDEAAGDLDDLLKWVGLTAQADQLPPQLSGTALTYSNPSGNWSTTGDNAIASASLDRASIVNSVVSDNAIANSDGLKDFVNPMPTAGRIQLKPRLSLVVPSDVVNAPAGKIMLLTPKLLDGW